jgi:NAD(P)-dependent dehydrogenase (short-subunit alcohol dehydrogenase family)
MACRGGAAAFGQAEMIGSLEVGKKAEEARMKIEGKTALVTGGAHRVGKAIALALAQAGANVAINYYSSDVAAQETVREAQALGVSALAVQADVGRLEQVRALVAAAADRFGAVDILVNSASIWQKTPLPMGDFSDWHRVLGVLLDGSMYLADAVAPMMLARGAGAIVNIVDLSAWKPFAGYIAHSVGKSGLLALTRQLALELAPVVSVNAVAPGPVLPPPGYSQEEIARVASRTLKGRWGSAQDVANAVRFLVESDYITGEVLVVDGGERMAPA